MSRVLTVKDDYNTFNHIFTVPVNGSSVPIQVNILLLTEYLHSAFKKFTSITGDLPTDIKIQLNNIIVETSSATKKIILIIATGLLLLLILLMVTIFAAVYWNDNYVIESAFLFAMFLIIVTSIVIYTWTFSIYTTSMNHINIYIKNINHHLKLINVALIPTLSCFTEHSLN